MTRLPFVILLAVPAFAAGAPAVTFHRDVEPILQKNCQGCHRPGQVAPMPHYDFNWQLGYNLSIKVPKGTVMRVDAHFDNSVNNKFNPNPNRTVFYGSMTWEEMMNPFYSVVVPKDANPREVVRSKYQQVGGGG